MRSLNRQQEGTITLSSYDFPEKLSDKPRNESTARQVARCLNTLLKSNPNLAQRYAKAKQTIRAFRKPAFYEIETKCNLKCEGCYYFEGGDTWKIDPNRENADWRLFFEQEAQHGVSMAYFVGAEPALSQDRLCTPSMGMN